MIDGHSFDFEIADHPPVSALHYPALLSTTGKNGATPSMHRRLSDEQLATRTTPVPNSWLVSPRPSKHENHSCSSVDGVLHVKGGDAGAGFATLFFIFPINHLLLADRHCLLPWFDFSQSRSPNYYDPGHGSNPWRYYFEPIGGGVSALEHQRAPVYELTEGSVSPRGERGGQYLAMHNGSPWAVRAYDHEVDWARRNRSHFNELWYARNRAAAAAIVARYIRVLPTINTRANALWKSVVLDGYRPIMAMHLRGGDKGGLWRHGIDAVDAYLPYARAFVHMYPHGRIMLATDDPKLLADVLHRNWPLVVRRAVVVPQPPTHDRNLHGGMRPKPCAPGAHCGRFEAGLEVLLDILLIAKCDYLLHGESAVSEAAIYIRPELHKCSVIISFPNKPTPDELFGSDISALDGRSRVCGARKIA